MTTITVNPDFITEPPAAVSFAIRENAALPPRGVRRMPLFVPRGQSYFWTAEWQAGEIEALRDLEQGNVRRFASGAEAAAWLLSDDE